MLTYDLNARGDASLYEYLYSCIRQDILNGVLKPGEKLPSKRELARHLTVGVITVANAYRQLETEGYIVAEERQGFFVADVTDYRKRSQADLSVDNSSWMSVLEEPQEPEYFADFKANRTGLSFFPATVWGRYMREALALPSDSLLKTVPYNGLFELRRAIAEFLKRGRGMDVSPAQIVIGAGTEYLYGRLMQMFGSEVTLAMEDPGYKKFASISKVYGNPWKYVPIDQAGLRVDALEESDADVVHVSPANHFPTGTAMPITRRLELFEWVNRKPGRYIIEDDYDSEFRYSGRYILPMYTESLSSKVIYINTFSKTLVPSLRISYMVLPVELLERYVHTMSFYSCTVSSFEQYALARFIDDGRLERHVARMRTYYRKQRQLMLDAVARSPLARRSEVLERNAGTHFLLRVDTNLSGEEIKRRALEKDMLVSLYSDFASSPTPDQERTLVINYAGIDREKIDEVLSRLASIFSNEG